MPDKQALSAITVFNKYAKFLPAKGRREVGAPGWWTGETDSNVPGRYWLSRFAALVAAKAAADEREAA